VSSALNFGIAAAVTACIAAGGTLTHAALDAQSQLFGRTLIAGSDPNEVALTYDDGPNDAATEALLEVLALHNVRATFFMIGKYVRQRHALVRRVHAAGHVIGNHTETHPWLSWQSDRIIQEELQRCQHAIEDTLGCAVRYFRPPHGARRPFVFRVAEELELKTVQWNAMGKDWKPIGASGILANLNRAMVRNQSSRIGTNILLHDGSDVALGADRSDTVAATATLLQRFAESGTKLVTVDAWG
jgi:peptidoglycan/xylan/chitin deacetylase (PgdA/CDA1 family)